MSKENIIELGYFKVNEKKNSIIENTPFQNNNITKNFNKIEKLSNDIKEDLLKNRKNVDITNINSLKIDKK